MTTVVVGAIATVKPFHVMERPFLRDVIFYLAAVFYAFYIMWKKSITIYEAVGECGICRCVYGLLVGVMC